MRRLTSVQLIAAAVLLVLPTIAQAGPPLICHPFQTAAGRLLPWGSGPGWNTPDRRYDVSRLTADTLSLLDPDAPILTRMENMRRAVIYATRDARVAEELLAAVSARAQGPNATRAQIFDAGYLIESYKQATHLFGRKLTTGDGYALVLRAMGMGTPDPAMEFAAALMSEGPNFESHLRRARAAVSADSLLARNITKLGW